MLVKLGILTLVVNKQILRKAWPPNGIACSNSVPFKGADATTHRVASTARLSRSCRCAASSAAKNSASASIHGLAVQLPMSSAMRKPSPRLLALVWRAWPRAALRSAWREAAKLPPRVMKWSPSVSQSSRQALPSVSDPDSPGAGEALANMHAHLQTRFGMRATLLFHARDTASAPMRQKRQRPDQVGALVIERCLRYITACDVRDA